MTTTSMQQDTQVTTVVQQIDAQGPVVVDRIATQFADVACTPENARKLVEALHSGTSVTLTSDASGQSKSATFTATGSHLGYGEAYIALALAGEALRNAGVSGCATPDQWRAVLLGGPLTAAGTSSTQTTSTSSASSSTSFPGIITLHSQGQGWGQVAQTAHVQLGQVVSRANSSLNLGSTTGSTGALSPTGRSSAEMNQSHTTSGSTTGSSGSDRASSKAYDQDKGTENGNKDNDKSASSSQIESSRTGNSPSSSSGQSSQSATSSPSSSRPTR